MGRFLALSWRLAGGTYRRHTRHQASLLAAGVAYYVLFSIIPLAILVTAVGSVVLRDPEVRDRLIDEIVAALPLSEDEGRSAVADAIEGVKRSSPPLSALGLLGTAYGALGMFGAIRRALNDIWEVAPEKRPSFLRQRLADAATLAALGLLALASVAASGTLRGLQETSSDLLGPFSNSANLLWLAVPYVFPAAVSFATFLAIYRLLPASHPSLRDAWPGAALAAIGFEVLKNGFTLYVANFNAYDVVYGTLGGVLLFLFFTYLTANLLLIGGAVSAELAALRAEPQPAHATPSWLRGALMRFRRRTVHEAGATQPETGEGTGSGSPGLR
ncbi:MAG TPA: YihY/virulence factor BrkB family protein [Dehalococcoidia bacterium]|nr:YihY/virulence factor BrkB family protein [Dehalococcoidia bacterium]